MESSRTRTAPFSLFGIALRRPSFDDITAASVLAVGLWLLTAGLLSRLGSPLDAFDAGASLLVIEWACVAAQVGVRPNLGARHLLANLAVSALLIGVYAASWGLLA
ncbi:MAG TPA: hypothetical protein VNU71_20070 [Burkholderiaceae bacterium]|nr:hypothetical protein [Burkholderiaceae bacterium]